MKGTSRAISRTSTAGKQQESSTNRAVAEKVTSVRAESSPGEKERGRYQLSDPLRTEGGFAVKNCMECKGNFRPFGVLARAWMDSMQRTMW
ncbi:hypothetical protein AMECASPLE_025965 [Ameca splendens]|uniref:Uncharacterized protein n=1 Tax=Ameca splendens TaxID=208324 RepID=A0ABV0XTZ2_9TELE